MQHHLLLLWLCLLSHLPYKTTVMEARWLRVFSQCITEYAVVVLLAHTFHIGSRRVTYAIRGGVVMISGLLVHYPEWLILYGILLTTCAHEFHWSYCTVAFTLFYLRLKTNLFMGLSVLGMFLTVFSLQR